MDSFECAICRFIERGNTLLRVNYFEVFQLYVCLGLIPRLSH
jgi:hypothetical protein